MYMALYQKPVFWGIPGIWNDKKISLRRYFKKTTSLGHFWPTYASKGFVFGIYSHNHKAGSLWFYPGVSYLLNWSLQNRPQKRNHRGWGRCLYKGPFILKWGVWGSSDAGISLTKEGKVISIVFNIWLHCNNIYLIFLYNLYLKLILLILII